ncbi:MAG: PaaI family thioesterase [Lachnospiraceae bacterium]|nr:PaaI family thioesterase [Lachnospiraceae bacterium]
MEEIEKVREMFRNDRYATETGAVIDQIGDHYARVSLVLNEHHKNAVGGVMGGVYFTLADFAFAVASNWQKPGTVSITSDISFIGVPKSEKVIAETELIKNGRSTCCYNVRVTDDLGTPLAAVKIVGFHKG